MMRIVVDASSVLLRSAGVKNYVWHWVNAMRGIAGRDAIRAFPFLGDLGALNHQGSPYPALPTLARLALVYGANVPGPWLDLLHRGCEVFHASNQTRIAPRRMKLTATIHDLTCFLMPELHTRGNVGADRDFARGILARADRLIAVSENTRRDAIEVLKLDPGRVETIYSGVPDSFFVAKPAARSRPYVLFVGTIEPRKNLGALLDAWKQVKARERFDLIIAGPAGWSSERTLQRIRAESVYRGYVPEAEMPGLTAGATAFVYPSLYEGFGFPVAQAMAAGVPVVTSNTSCLPEVAAEAALYADPRSATEIAAQLDRVLESESLRTRMAAAGRERARAYRWDNCARASLRFFERVAG
ncbi:MAG: glycosyltransferase family 4 protein [Bryobacteraceae bacterium]|nr:glycosyltransferase family 4 protein [Bryobacteraceae bacterium]